MLTNIFPNIELSPDERSLDCFHHNARATLEPASSDTPASCAAVSTLFDQWTLAGSPATRQQYSLSYMVNSTVTNEVQLRSMHRNGASLTERIFQAAGRHCHGMPDQHAVRNSSENNKYAGSFTQLLLLLKSTFITFI
jgi:hypothetical protein